MKKHFYLLVFLSLLGLMDFNALASEKIVHVTTPGTLKALLASDDMSRITRLTISGQLNSADCNVIGSYSSRLDTIDMKNVGLPSNKIPDFMFYGAVLKQIVFPDNLEIIGGSAFEEAWLEDVLVLPSTLKKIESAGLRFSYPYSGLWYANCVRVDFSQCKNSLETIDDFQGPEAYMVNYGNFDFSDFTKLKIGARAMSSATLWGKVTLPKYLEIVPIAVFSGSAFTSITLHKAVKQIQDAAFSGTSAEQLIMHSENPPALGKGVFSSSDIKSVYVPEKSLAKYKAASGWNALADKIKPIIPDKVALEYTEDGGNTIHATYEGVRIGEYYWMNTSFNNGLWRYSGPLGQNGGSFSKEGGEFRGWYRDYTGLTKNGIDKWHEGSATYLQPSLY